MEYICSAVKVIGEAAAQQKDKVHTLMNVPLAPPYCQHVKIAARVESAKSSTWLQPSVITSL